MSPAEQSQASVEIVVGRAALARWVLRLATTLHRHIPLVGIRLVDEVVDGAASVRLLLSLEQLLLKPGAATGIDRVTPAELGCFAREIRTPRIVIDLTAAGVAQRDGTMLRPAFNGQFGETALAGALFFDGTPEITIARRDGIGEWTVVAAGTASLEAASSLGGKMDAVLSRVITLIGKAVGPAKNPLQQNHSLAPLRRIGTKNLLSYSASAIASRAVRAVYELCCHPSHWRIGWRFVPPGRDVWSRRSLEGLPWNVLADPVDHFFADPFPWSAGGRDVLFFEDLDYKTNKGTIAVVEFRDGQPGTPRTVLEEPWHLSYPFLIEWKGELFMIPESSAAREIVAYRAVDFPHRWERHAVLIGGVEAADATIVEHNGKLWLFAVVRDRHGGYSDTLAIWSADDLFGPWSPHRDNPVLADDRFARPAGNMVVRDGRLYRPVQDCRAAYGAATNLMRVTRLNEGGFEQEPEATLGPAAPWPGRRMHTLNYNGRLEVIDGVVLRPKLKVLADRVDARFAPPR